MVWFPSLAAIVVVFTLALQTAHVLAQGGYVVRGNARVINGNTIVIDGTEITLSGVELVDTFSSQATRALKRRISKSKKTVGCMVDGNWSGKNWAYCGDPNKKSSRDIKKTLNAWMVKSGNAKSNKSWGLFDAEERNAKRKGKGLWKN